MPSTKRPAQRAGKGSPMPSHYWDEIALCGAPERACEPLL